MSSGYIDLVSFYDAIFPLSPARKTFCEPLMAQCQASLAPWLDVGCGTGLLLQWLAERGINARGLEPDAEFAESARRKIRSSGATVVHGGAEDMARVFPEEIFQVISCMGNAVAHLQDHAALSRFFADCGGRMKKDGVMAIQIVNFDRYVKKGQMNFPVLERNTADGRSFTFKRQYIALGDRRDAILFKTELEHSEEVITNETTLLILKQSDLASVAGAFFSDLRFYGDFDRSPWNEDSPATILECRGFADGN